MKKGSRQDASDSSAVLAAIAFKTDPDEKGIETRLRGPKANSLQQSGSKPTLMKKGSRLQRVLDFARRDRLFKTDPDEKGIETRPPPRACCGATAAFKTDPDEKGIETFHPTNKQTHLQRTVQNRP